jgi:hypothetical protein
MADRAVRAARSCLSYLPSHSHPTSCRSRPLHTKARTPVSGVLPQQNRSPRKRRTSLRPDLRPHIRHMRISQLIAHPHQARRSPVPLDLRLHLRKVPGKQVTRNRQLLSIHLSGRNDAALLTRIMSIPSRFVVDSHTQQTRQRRFRRRTRQHHSVPLRTAGSLITRHIYQRQYSFKRQPIRMSMHYRKLHRHRPHLEPRCAPQTVPSACKLRPSSKPSTSPMKPPITPPLFC